MIICNNNNYNYNKIPYSDFLDMFETWSKQAISRFRKIFPPGIALLYSRVE